MITAEIVSQLLCPTCQLGELNVPGTGHSNAQFAEAELICCRCECTYPLRDGVPGLIPHGAVFSQEWKAWREHLDKFQARRDCRIGDPNRAVTRLAKKSKPHKPFAEFTGIAEGRVLDVGCGPGKFRFNFSRERVEYIGLDPIALPEAKDFPFIRGLGEYIPFKHATFTDVVVLAALDHFRDIDRFLHEVKRILRPGGKLHVLQSIHEIRGPASAVKVLSHKLKDTIEEWSMNDRRLTAPKHLSEFTGGSLVNLLKGHFHVVSEQKYSASWYSPVKMFLSLVPRDVQHATR